MLTLERTYDKGPRGTQMVKISPGEYRMVRRWYNRGGYGTWQVIGGIVTAERLILVHKGAFEEHSEGCILVGIGHTGVSGASSVGTSYKSIV